MLAVIPVIVFGTVRLVDSNANRRSGLGSLSIYPAPLDSGQVTWLNTRWSALWPKNRHQQNAEWRGPRMVRAFAVFIRNHYCRRTCQETTHLGWITCLPGFAPCPQKR